MKIYFGASISLDRSMLPVYQRIVEELKKQGHRVLSEHVVDPKLVPGAGLSAGKLFARETRTIEKAEVMVAEVSAPSWGTAFLMEHALEKGKPVLALYYKDKEKPLPLMLAGYPELYVDHYDLDNLAVCLKKNLSHFEQMQNRKGKLVVIDGADGAGKATQTKLLLEYLEKKGTPGKYISFPRYKTSFHGQNVGRFLNGEFGGNTEVSPYLSSLAFALDRLTAREQIMSWLKEGNLVVADRYVSASLAHQGSKLPSKKQEAFLQWLYTMEYQEHKLPKEDVVIFLDVPAEFSRQLMKKQGRIYDKAESDFLHQKKTINLYRKLCQKYKHWEMINCVNREGKLLSKEEIHRKVIKLLRKRRIIN